MEPLHNQIALARIVQGKGGDYVRINAHPDLGERMLASPQTNLWG